MAPTFITMSFEPHLHWSFDNEHILLSSLVLNSFANFSAAAVVVAAICATERFVTSAPRAIKPIECGFIRLLGFLLDAGWVPRRLRHSRLSSAVWRTGVYSFATFLRLYVLHAITRLNVVE